MKVTLYDGPFHRKEVEIGENQLEIRMPIPRDFLIKQFDAEDILLYKPPYTTYLKKPIHIGIYNKPVKTIFLHEDSNIDEFLSRIFLDYLR